MALGAEVREREEDLERVVGEREELLRTVREAKAREEGVLGRLGRVERRMEFLRASSSTMGELEEEREGLREEAVEAMALTSRLTRAAEELRCRIHQLRDEIQDMQEFL